MRRLLLLALPALVLAVPPAASARTCAAPTKALGKLSVKRTGCATARRVAGDAAAVRRDPTRFAKARRCRGSFCIVVRGWRCSPVRSAKPRERCVRRRASISWQWRS